MEIIVVCMDVRTGVLTDNIRDCEHLMKKMRWLLKRWKKDQTFLKLYTELRTCNQ